MPTQPKRDAHLNVSPPDAHPSMFSNITMSLQSAALAATRQPSPPSEGLADDVLNGQPLDLSYHAALRNYTFTSPLSKPEDELEKIYRTNLYHIYVLEFLSRRKIDADPPLVVPETLLEALRVPPTAVEWIPNDYEDEREAPSFLVLLRAFSGTAIVLLEKVFVGVIGKVPGGVDVDTLLVVLSSFTNSCDSWSTPLTSSRANSLLRQFSETFSPTIVTDIILTNIVKKVFEKAPSPHGTTAAGTASMSTPLKIRNTKLSSLDEPPSASYIHHTPTLPTLLMSAVNLLPSEVVESNFHLILPPILHLVDSPHAYTKRAAYPLVTALLKKISRGFLERRGVAPVLWEAVKGGTYALPPLTPGKLSVIYLERSYEALRALASLREKDEKEVQKWRDKLMDSVIMGLSGPERGVLVTKELLRQMRYLVEETPKGNAVNKWLRSTIPLVREVLADPFIGADKELAGVAAETLTVLIEKGEEGIRETGWGWEVFGGVGLCWGRLKEEGVDDTDVREKLRGVLRVLKETLDGGIWQEIEEVVEDQEKLAGLLEDEAKGDIKGQPNPSNPEV